LGEEFRVVVVAYPLTTCWKTDALFAACSASPAYDAVM
jgi:hypothetical protein